MRNVKRYAFALLLAGVVATATGCGCSTDPMVDDGTTTNESNTTNKNEQNTTDNNTTKNTTNNNGVIDDIGNGIGEGIEDIGNGISNGINDLTNGTGNTENVTRDTVDETTSGR